MDFSSLIVEEKQIGGQNSIQKESSIYENLGLHWIPPELREDRGELEWFTEHDQMPLVQQEQIQCYSYT